MPSFLGCCRKLLLNSVIPSPPWFLRAAAWTHSGSTVQAVLQQAEFVLLHIVSFYYFCLSITYQLFIVSHSESVLGRAA